MTALPAPLSSWTMRTALPAGGLTEILPHLEPSGVWIREADGMIGLGTAAQTFARGSERFAELARWWDSAAPAEDGFPDELRDTPGAGPMAFTAIAYSADSSAASRLIIPELILGSLRGHSWLTVIGASADGPPNPEDLKGLLARYGLQIDDAGDSGLRVCAEPLLSPGSRSDIGAAPLPRAELRPGTHSEAHHLQAVSAGVRAITERRLEKLVIARDALVVTEGRLRPGPVLSRLAAGYPTCWTYYAGEVLGTTPEMLVKVRGAEVSARVLAGTVERAPDHGGAATAADEGSGEAHALLLEDVKQLNEHLLAVESLLEQLAPVTEELVAAELPEVLELPNVYHLSTDVTGRLSRNCPQEGSSGTETLPPALLVAERAHPTAAICGTPTATAAELISTLEELDRGLFSGPVGWVDARGNADFGIALRGGVLEDPPQGDGTQVRLYAGGGIVAGSDPEAELAETRAKMRPMLYGLGVED